jgi:hypothetical protein
LYILTDRELEFLVQLQKSWRRLYLNEIARLMTENGEENPQINANMLPVIPTFRICEVAQQTLQRSPALRESVRHVPADVAHCA